MSEHLLSLILVTSVLAGCGLLLSRNAAKAPESMRIPAALAGMRELDFSTPFGRALLRDALDAYFPGRADQNEHIAQAIEEARDRSLSRDLMRTHVRERLTLGKAGQLTGMYAQFLVVYLIVMAMTYYGVETIGVWRFVRRRRRVEEMGRAGKGVVHTASRALQAAAGFAASFILFSPAYVIAYTIRTEFSTDSTAFMIALAVISNGLLMVYSNKFYSLLVAESRKGYVETALAKNLHSSYAPKARDGVSLRAVLRPFKRFDGHVLGHIFANARIQYISSVKEQACFLITGLIIIEMALNIHGRLCYEMLRQILYRNYGIVIAIVLSIFYTVKATEIAIDGVMHRVAKRYENR